MPQKQIFLFCLLFSMTTFAEIITFLGNRYDTQTTIELSLANYDGEIPNDIGKFHYLEKLTLKLNNLKALPLEMVHLTNLKEINFTLFYEGMKASDNAVQHYSRAAKFNTSPQEHLDSFLESMKDIFYPLKKMEELVIVLHIINVNNQWTIDLVWQPIHLKLNACNIKAAK